MKSSRSRSKVVKRQSRDTVWKKQIKPRLDEIALWLEEDVSKAEICRRLGVASETMRRIALEQPALEKIWRADIAVYSDRRTCVYENFVANRFEEIEKWVRGGATVQQICSELGISSSQWYRYLTEHAELAGIVAVGRQGLSSELRGVLCRKALGYEYVERVVKKDSDGTVISETEYHKMSHPDVKAIEALLRNYDDTWRTDDAGTAMLKREKLELEKMVADSKIF